MPSVWPVGARSGVGRGGCLGCLLFGLYEVDGQLLDGSLKPGVLGIEFVQECLSNPGSGWPARATALRDLHWVGWLRSRSGCSSFPCGYCVEPWCCGGGADGQDCPTANGFHGVGVSATAVGAEDGSESAADVE